MKRLIYFDNNSSSGRTTTSSIENYFIDAFVKELGQKGESRGHKWSLRWGFNYL